jgi:hypothetical protein
LTDMLLLDGGTPAMLKQAGRVSFRRHIYFDFRTCHIPLVLHSLSIARPYTFSYP